MAIAFVAGTTAEIIKLAPVMAALRENGSPGMLWNTAQHVHGLRDVLDELGLPQPDEHFIDSQRQRPLVSAGQVPGWAARVLRHSLIHRRRLRHALRHDGRPPTVVVHGDTFTTVVGAALGRMLFAQVAHVEAGQRSGRLLHPLPEEINRRLVAQLAGLHFAPTDREVLNLRRERARGDIVDTGANTAIDTLRWVISTERQVDDPTLPETYGLVTLHRFEMLRNDRLFADTVRLLSASSAEVPMLMPVGDIERGRIDTLGLQGLFDHDRFRLVPKYSYARFVPLLQRAAFVVTDSGGLQQECAVLGLPCAVHREATESHQGLGQNVVLTEWKLERLQAFLCDWRHLRVPSRLEEHHPTQVILDDLRNRGVIGG